MREFLLGALSVGVPGVGTGFLAQRPATHGKSQAAPEYLLSSRYQIFDPSGAIPMLLDTKTGRTWFRQYGAKDAEGNSTGLLWSPVRITPADTGKAYFEPGSADVSR